MKVTVTQLAWYIERDGWRRVSGAPRGFTRYAAPDGSGLSAGAHVDIADYHIPALDRERDTVYRRLRDRVQDRANR